MKNQFQQNQVHGIVGGDGDVTLTGGPGADVFSCGGGEDTITDYNEAEGDTKTADCENF
jgi:Ca2+-binding RTX toxin-like protein